MSQRKIVEAKIIVDQATEKEVAVTVTGFAAETLDSPEKVQKLLEVLDLPQGTKATLVVTAASTIVR